LCPYTTLFRSLVSLAVASAVFTSGYAATWRALARASAEQANGADVRAVFSGDALDPAEVDDARGVKAVAAAAPVATAPIRIGSDTASLTALAPELMTNVMLDAGGTVDVAAIADDLASAPVGLELSPASTALRVSVAALAPESDRRGVVMVSAWISDRDGALVSLPLGTAAVGAGEQSDLAAPLPEDGGPWRLLAVDGALSGADGATGIGLTVLSWGTDADDSATLPVPPSASAPLSSREPLSRVMATEASATTVPAVITSALAARLGLGVGDRFDYQFDGLLRSGSAEVRGTAPSVPGSTNPLGVILPLGALDDALLRENDSPAPADEIWAAATTDADLDSVADDVSTALDGAATISTATPGPATRLAEPGVAAAWAGVAAAIALAVIAIVAITVTLLAGRSAEAGLLRALGVSARAQSGGRSVELAVVAAAGLVMGVGIGAVAVLCAAVPFARGSVAEAAGTIVLPPVVDAATLGVAIAVLLAAVAGVIAVYAVRVRDQAAHAIIAGDAA
ncbi:MAG: FtsX-like permease family protein, partial [Leifsonia sp.]